MWDVEQRKEWPIYFWAPHLLSAVRIRGCVSATAMAAIKAE
jgi:hypothetical protein